MRLYAFYHGRFGGERLAWIDRQPGSLWIVVNGYAVAMCWGNWSWKLDPYGPEKATPSAAKG